jgi:hypothetical protein
MGAPRIKPLPPGSSGASGNAMMRQRKRRKKTQNGHVAAYHRGVASTVIRSAIEELIRPRVKGGRRWECPTIREVVGGLGNGRAKQFVIRDWTNGRRRAPAWFIAVLDGELARQIEHRQAIREQLARYETGDRRKGPEASARGRYHRMRQLGRPVNEGAPITAPQIDASADPSSPTPKLK